MLVHARNENLVVVLKKRRAVRRPGEVEVNVITRRCTREKSTRVSVGRDGERSSIGGRCTKQTFSVILSILHEARRREAAGKHSCAYGKEYVRNRGGHKVKSVIVHQGTRARDASSPQRIAATLTCLRCVQVPRHAAIRGGDNPRRPVALTVKYRIVAVVKAGDRPVENAVYGEHP